MMSNSSGAIFWVVACSLLLSIYSSAAAAADSVDCVDDPTFRFKNHVLKTCAYFALLDDNERAKKCSKHSSLRKACPLTCQTCPTDEESDVNVIVDEEPQQEDGNCVDDPVFRFKNKEKKSCKWISQKKKRIKKMCKKKHVKKACLETCQKCPIPSEAPSEDPSSASPSAAPTPMQKSEIPSSISFESQSQQPTDRSSSDEGPSGVPSNVPSNIPSEVPSVGSSDVPSTAPSDVPSNIPSEGPSDIPSEVPPSEAPSSMESFPPTNVQQSSSSSSSLRGGSEPKTAEVETMTDENAVETDLMVMDSMCMTTNGMPMETIAFPENALLVLSTDPNKQSVEYRIVQEWINSDVVLAIQNNESNECSVNEPMEFGSETPSYVGNCDVDGSVSLEVVVHFDTRFDPAQCEACSIDSLITTDLPFYYEVCSYNIQIPCDSDSNDDSSRRFLRYSTL